jgi:hypothetical protein
MQRSPFEHGDLIQPDRVDELIDRMAPTIEAFLALLEPGEFTTTEFIDFFSEWPEGNIAYNDAIRNWGESNQNMSRMVIDGQVIPGILRRQSNVEWLGYAHGEPGPFAVPAWWRLRE